MEMFNVLEARNNLSSLVARAEAGEEIVIARRGMPVAKIVPYFPKRGMTGREMVQWLEDNPIPESQRKTAEEVDEVIRDILEGREDS
ncbi:type II toxin-antitoxin system Phd/YefM family antitoxin [Herbiconiux sp. P17]|uniref:type II toxin-antitoxin system Phd/YefM family antitoxin n=1 Tax=Herbiconiux wuyangfengii TaxID=3342794 RepID=UPI0035B9D3C2